MLRRCEGITTNNNKPLLFTIQFRECRFVSHWPLWIDYFCCIKFYCKSCFEYFDAVDDDDDDEEEGTQIMGKKIISSLPIFQWLVEATLTYTYVSNRWTVWPDCVIFYSLGKFFKALATISLPKSLTFLGNFCKGVKILNFSSEIIFGQLLQTFGYFYLVTLQVKDLPTKYLLIEHFSWIKTGHCFAPQRHSATVHTTWCLIFLNGPNPANFFLFFSHIARTNLTIIEKSIDGMLGSQTWGGRMEGADESNELWWHPMPHYSYSSILNL